MRFIFASTLLFALCSPVALGDDDAVDILRNKQAKEREEAKAIGEVFVKVYYIEDLVPLFAGGPKRGCEKVVALVGKNVPSLPRGTASAFPTNLSLVVSATDANHKDVEAYLTKLRKAREVLREAGFELVESN